MDRDIDIKKNILKRRNKVLKDIWNICFKVIISMLKKSLANFLFTTIFFPFVLKKNVVIILISVDVHRYFIFLICDHFHVKEKQ